MCETVPGKMHRGLAVSSLFVHLPNYFLETSSLLFLYKLPRRKLLTGRKKQPVPDCATETTGGTRELNFWLWSCKERENI